MPNHSRVAEPLPFGSHSAVNDLECWTYRVLLHLDVGENFGLRFNVAFETKPDSSGMLSL